MGLSRCPPQDRASTGRVPLSPGRGGRSSAGAAPTLGSRRPARQAERGVGPGSAEGRENSAGGRAGAGSDFPECTLWPICRTCQSSFAPFRKRPEGQRPKSSASPIPPEAPGGCAAPPLPHPAWTGLPAPPGPPGQGCSSATELRDTGQTQPRAKATPSRSFPEYSNFFTPLLVGRKKRFPHPRLRKRFPVGALGAAARLRMKPQVSRLRAPLSPALTRGISVYVSAGRRARRQPMKVELELVIEGFNCSLPVQCVFPGESLGLEVTAANALSRRPVCID